MREFRSPIFIHPIQRLFGPAALERMRSMQRVCDEYGLPPVPSEETVIASYDAINLAVDILAGKFP